MDNTSLARLSADIVIYPTVIFENNLDWEGFSGKVYYGADYVPIADSFVKAGKQVAGKELQPPYSVLITMGGSDPNHLTGRIVSALLDMPQKLHLKVVIGPAFSFDDILDKIGKQGHSNVEIIREADDLSAVMTESHIAITALGTTIYELACMGVPSIIIANYRTDDKAMRLFESLGIAMPLGYHEDVTRDGILMAVETFIKDRKIYEEMSEKCRLLIDGHGAERISDIVVKMLK